MRKIINKWLLLTAGLYSFFVSSAAYAVDSYRYAHVTIETPWMIFLFLLVIVLLPFIVMAILYWRYAFVKDKSENTDAE